MSLEKKIFASRAFGTFLGVVLRAYRFLLYGGLRFDHDPLFHRLLRSRERVIYAVWHQDFVYTLGYVSRFNARRPTWVLASASRDGGMAVAAASAMGYRGAVRGSSARGGAAALLGLHRLAKRVDASIAVVCDGPRPPARRLTPGVLHLARDTGLPIWLVRTSYAPVRTLERTWARFQIPHMFGRAAVRVDGPIHVPRDADRRDLEVRREDLERRLNALTERADRAARGLPEAGA